MIMSYAWSACVLSQINCHGKAMDESTVRHSA
jgi:hypothetical protein